MSTIPRGTTGAAIAISFTGIAFVTLAARLYTRFHLVKNAGWEEFAITVAWVCLQFDLISHQTSQILDIYFDVQFKELYHHTKTVLT